MRRQTERCAAYSRTSCRPTRRRHRRPPRRCGAGVGGGGGGGRARDQLRRGDARPGQCCVAVLRGLAAQARRTPLASSAPTSRPPPPSGTTEGGDGTKQQARRVEPTGRRWNTYERRVPMSNEAEHPADCARRWSGQRPRPRSRPSCASGDRPDWVTPSLDDPDRKAWRHLGAVPTRRRGAEVPRARDLLLHRGLRRGVAVGPTAENITDAAARLLGLAERRPDVADSPVRRDEHHRGRPPHRRGHRRVSA